MFVPQIEGEAERVDIVGRGFVDAGRGDLRNGSGEGHGFVGLIVALARVLDGKGMGGVESRGGLDRRL